jgi:hypothetical protein
VFSKTFDEHLENLAEVCEKIRSANLKLHPDKCVLVQNEVTFLGHKISKDGIKTDDEKTNAVRNWPTPRNIKEVRSFIGLCSYYRRFVKGFATIAKPLHQYTEKGRKFEWTKECDTAFGTLKHFLVEAPILGYPMYRGDFILDTDASDVGMGAVLS